MTPLGIEAKLQWDTTLRHPGVSFALIDAKTSIQGRLEPSLSNIRASFSGQLDSQTLAPLLAQYDLFVPGIFDLRPTNLHFGADRLTMLSPSQLQWSGGQVRYILANRRYDALMPPLFASITARDDGAREANVTLSATRRACDRAFEPQRQRLPWCDPGDATPGQLPLDGKRSGDGIDL